MGPVGGHPGATIVPVALACAERAQSSGADLLAAVVAGYEVAVRLGHALDGGDQPSDSRAWQIFGCAAAAGALARLSVSQIIDAFGLAGMNAPPVFMPKFHEPSGAIGWLKNNSGWIALGGLLAVDLATHGLRGNRRFLDGDAVNMLGGRSWRPEALIRDLGRTFKVNEISLKRFSACYHLQTTLEALEQLQRSHAFKPRDVERVEVRLVSGLAARKFSFMPGGVMDVPFSIPIVCALLLAGVPTGHAWFDPAVLRDELVIDLASRVSIAPRPRAHPREPETASTVAIRLADGTEAVQTVDVPRGSPARPLEDADVIRKFRTLAIPVIGPDVASRIVESVFDLERVSRLDHALNYGGEIAV
jgi:2-methylcitrate dehydratase PrpD